MKCTRVVTVDGITRQCEKETGLPLPEIWAKHQKFDPIILRAFFIGTGRVTEEEFALLDNFVCPDCMPAWRKHVNMSDSKRKIS